MKLIFVHGRRQGGKDADEPRLFWKGCLNKSLRATGLSWRQLELARFGICVVLLEKLTDEG
jgi:hypothetical protein